MVNDRDTNTVYFSSLLAKRHKKFADRLYNILTKHGFTYNEIFNTKDIWCRDYMPVQIGEKEAVQFKFDPSYLKFKKYSFGKTDTQQLYFERTLSIKYSNIILDGGNLVKFNDKIILTNRVLKENNKELENTTNELKKTLGANTVLFLPELPNDATGHADGMVRFIDENNVLVNDYTNITAKAFCKKLFQILKENGLRITLLPNAFSYNRNYNDATGDYNNFLQIGKLIIIPQYGYSLDSVIIDAFRRYFSDCEIEGVMSNEISKLGGVLNCISWTIKN